MAKRNRDVTDHSSSLRDREESFGEAAGEIAVGGGTMRMFGHKIHSGIWPTDTVGPTVKTGFPRDFDKATARGPRR